MKTAEFNQNFEVDRKARAGVRANPKNTPAEAITIMTADGAPYDSGETYYFFDAQSAEVRQSVGLRRDGEFLATFGLKVVAISKLRVNRDDALADGQAFFKSEIEKLQTRIQSYEFEKTVDFTD